MKISYHFVDETARGSNRGDPRLTKWQREMISVFRIQIRRQKRVTSIAGHLTTSAPVASSVSKTATASGSLLSVLAITGQL